MRDRIATCRITRTRKVIPALRGYAHIVYVLRGEVETYVEGSEKPWKLSHEHGLILVVNPGERLEVLPQPSAMVVLVQLDVLSLRRELNDRLLVFSCDPTMRHQKSYRELAHCLDALLLAQAQTGDFAGFHKSAAELDLVRCLLDGFGGTVTRTPSRADVFAGYLELHYDEPLTLAQTARRFHLSTEHFAKTFKTEVGVTYHTYLTKLRLEAAVKQLAAGDETISRVALEAGFPNTASFNQAFRERFDMTPTEYRKAHRVERKAVPASVMQEATRLVSRDDALPEDAFAIDIDARASLNPLHESWRDMIGLGPIENLSDARVREQALELQRHLGFRWCRVSCDFGAYADGHDSYQIDSCFDFLVGNGMVPHVLVVRGKQMDADGYMAALAQALRRFVNRYSVQTIRAWRFELLMQEDEARGPYDAYLDFFERVSEMLESYESKHLLAGPGILPDYDAGNLKRFLRTASKRNVRFGAVTIACRPGTTSADTPLVRTADRHYLRNQVLLARKVLAEEGYDPGLLAVGSWRDSLETSNVMNDSCYEGASIMQTVLSAWDLVGSLCYNDALDLSLSASSGDAFLSGRPGLISRDSIPKPSYFAFDFLGRINRHLVYADEYCLASTNDMGNFQMVCHNCERLNITYLTTPERLLDYRLMNSYFEEERDRLLRARITGARPGTYLVKARFVNAEGGSVGDEAQRMRLWCMDEPSRSEIIHLKAASQPQMTIERVHTSDGTIVFEHLLKSNEIAYFHVIYLY